MPCSNYYLLFRNQGLIHVLELWYARKNTISVKAIICILQELITGLVSITAVLE